MFLEDGLANIASRMAYVFDRLERLRDCVILFDEIEEFCLDRTTPGLGMESRILTTAMLTRLNDLRRAERSIFLVATCVEIKILRHVRAESSHHPPRHRRDACSMARRCRFLIARPSQDGRVGTRRTG